MRLVLLTVVCPDDAEATTPHWLVHGVDVALVCMLSQVLGMDSNMSNWCNVCAWQAMGPVMGAVRSSSLNVNPDAFETERNTFHAAVFQSIWRAMTSYEQQEEEEEKWLKENAMELREAVVREVPRRQR